MERPCRNVRLSPRQALWGGVGALCFAVSSLSHAGIEDPQSITFKPQSLSNALVKLGEKAGVSIIFSDRAVSGIEIDSLKGEFNLTEALGKILEGTGLEYRVISQRAIAVVQQDLDLAVSEEMPQLTEEMFYLEELLVQGRQITGSRLRQADANGFAPVEILTGTELRLSGAQSLSDLLKFIPVVSGNSTSTAVSNGGDGTATVTLRGLPASNTLVLLNGNRIASNGFGGNSVDINTIPTAAIERIEILKDGASAIYGSDAIAGVVNVILRKHYDGLRIETYYGQSSRNDNGTANANLIWGAENHLGSFMVAANYYSQNGFNSRDRDFSRSADGRPFGGVDKRSTGTPTARITLGEEALILTDGLTGTSPEDFRVATSEDLFDYPQFTSSLSPSERVSVYLNGLAELTERVSATFTTSYTKSSADITFAPTPVFTAFEGIALPIAADNPFNPFGEEITDLRRRVLEVGPRVQENKNEASRLSLGLQGDMTDWMWSVTYNWSKTKASEHFTGLINGDHLQQGLGSADQCTGDCVPINLFGPAGSIDAEQADYLRTEASSFGETLLNNLTADFSTELWELPAGQIGLAFGLEARNERISIAPDSLANDGVLLGGSNFTSSSGSRNIYEGYVEWMVPLVSNKPGIKDLDLNIAIRHSSYDDFGSTTNPKVSLKYQPTNQWILRSTYSEGFRAPSLIELFKGSSQSQATLHDPCSKAENVGVLLGCTQQTDPLRTQYLTRLGGNRHLSPETSRNFSLGTSWQPAAFDTLSLSLDYFDINQNNVIDANAQFFVTTNATLGLFPDRVVRDENGEITQVISTKENLGSREVSGFDMGASWHNTFDSIGTLATNLSATHLHKYLSQISPRSPSRNLAGTFEDDAADGNGALPNWKMHLSLYWQLNQWEAAYSLNYVSELTEIASNTEEERTIESWATHDLQMSYLLFQGATRVTLGIDNLLDTPPPFAASAFNDNFDSRNYDGTGRYWYAKLALDF